MRVGVRDRVRAENNVAGAWARQTGKAVKHILKASEDSTWQYPTFIASYTLFNKLQ